MKRKTSGTEWFWTKDQTKGWHLDHSRKVRNHKKRKNCSIVSLFFQHSVHSRKIRNVEKSQRTANFDR
jgi:hypothetical protein